MKHPSWCEQNNCEAGWHMLSASYSNDGLARLTVRLCQNVDTSQYELDLGRDGSDGFNSISDLSKIKDELQNLKTFKDELGLIISALSKVKEAPIAQKKEVSAALKKTKKEHPNGARGAEWIDFCKYIANVTQHGSKIINLIEEDLPHLKGKDYSKPDSFSDEEAWEILTWTSK